MSETLTPEIEVVREELTYRDGGEHSYFRDLVSAFEGNYQATTRQEQHGRETRVELERRDKAARLAIPKHVELRANPDRTAGQGGSLAPPLWLIDLLATAPRAPRVLANELPTFPLPQGVQSINIPRLTTGTTTQTVNDLGADPGTDIVDTSATSPVVTISGHGDVSMQVLEQSGGSGLDFALFKDLSEDYDAKLEAQLINGSGTGGQLAGLLNVVPTANIIAYTDASPTAPELYTALGKAAAAIGNTRKLPPEMWLLTTSRMVWIGQGEDNSLRPLLLTNREESGEFDLLVWPAKLDDAIPTNLTYNTSTHTWATGGTQDVVIACRPSDGLLFEGAPHMAVRTEVLSGTLQARIQMHRYVAALVGRYPSGIAVVADTGEVVQSGF